MTASMQCLCGFNATGTSFEVVRAYRSHACEFHETEVGEQPHATPASWQHVTIALFVCVLLSFVCTNGWGRFS